MVYDCSYLWPLSPFLLLSSVLRQLGRIPSGSFSRTDLCNHLSHLDPPPIPFVSRRCRYPTRPRSRSHPSNWHGCRRGCRRHPQLRPPYRSSLPQLSRPLRHRHPPHLRLVSRAVLVCSQQLKVRCLVFRAGLARGVMF